ncbi:hypothetical protein B296_00023030 [Ensete ventricosum]|uniref:3-hydroxyacyl-CoA dehydrogenase C-terminal domain-containing protein n=1 Tax=Ensete ventricosum TaxID=4639 RepID=A0A427A2M3_ENSVE|nr:hypothetical protein B296_00023030 [Ensete ventricosum]
MEATEPKAKQDEEQQETAEMEKKVARTEMEVGADGVAVITIINPPINCLSFDVMWSLKDNYEEALRRDDVKAIVLTGQGPNFSGGFDIAAFEDIQGGNNGQRTQRLPRLVGLPKALEMLLLSKGIGGEEACKLGLVDAIVSPDELVETARRWALDIAESRKPWIKSLYRTDKLEPLEKAREVLQSARVEARNRSPNVQFPSVCIDVIEEGIVSGPRAGLWKVGIVGGGLTSSGIATALILSNYQVILKEEDENLLESTIGRVKAVVDLLDVAEKIHKTPIVVRNCTGFAVNRMLFAHAQSAFLLVDHGLDVYKIDHACTKFGLPMGPFRAADLVGLGAAGASGMQFLQSYPERVYKSMLMSVMIEDKREGEASGKGFYKYDEKRNASPDPEIIKYVEKSRNMANVTPNPQLMEIPDEDIVEMLLFPVINEACRILDEGIAVRATDLDIATAMGMGFPAYRFVSGTSLA